MTPPSLEALHLSLRQAVSEDSFMVWYWRNDEVTRQNSRRMNPIPLEAHIPWFQASLQDPHQWMRIIQGHPYGKTPPIPMGCLRLTYADQPEVHIMIAPQWRQKGIGTWAIQALADEAFRVLAISRLFAYIKPDNVESQRAFVNAGFDRTEVVMDGLVQYVRRARST